MLLCTPELMPAIDLQHRAWDTQHFGYPVASISNSDLEPEGVEHALQAAQKQGYQLVYWASNREYDINSAWMREYQGILVDRKTTYSKKLSPMSARKNSGCFQFVEWNPDEHCPELIELGVAAGLWSRFGVDPRIDREKFRSLYETWMRKSLARELSDMVLVVKEPGLSAPLGMVTISIKQGVGQIGLIAVSEQQRGRGLGKLLVNAADRWMIAHGAHVAQVVTQLQNVAACRLYEQAGYKVEAIEYFYHFWLPARVPANRS
jgi:dTDP-4-amino-4,6-dideoxy-D-galactose acyltransferase